MSLTLAWIKVLALAWNEDLILQWITEWILAWNWQDLNIPWRDFNIGIF